MEPARVEDLAWSFWLAGLMLGLIYLAVYQVAQGEACSPCMRSCLSTSCHGRACVRDFERGTVIASSTSTTTMSFTTPHRDIATGEVATLFSVPQGDARIFVTLSAVYLPFVAGN